MTIEQDIFKFHYKLTGKRIAKHFHYKLVSNIQFKIVVIIGCFVLYILSMCIIFRSNFPIIETHKNQIMWIAIIDAIITSMMLFIKKDAFIVLIKENNKIVNLDLIKQEVIYLYLLKKKYISRNRDNSYFYFSILQSTQFKLAKETKESVFTFFVSLTTIGFPILSFILDGVDTQTKIDSTLICISTCAFFATLFYFIKSYDKRSEYQDLYSLMLGLQIKDSIKR